MKLLNAVKSISTKTQLLYILTYCFDRYETIECSKVNKY